MRIRRGRDVDDIEVIAGKKLVGILRVFGDAVLGAQFAAAIFIERAENGNLEEILVPVVADHVAGGDTGADDANAQFLGHDISS